MPVAKNEATEIVVNPITMDSITVAVLGTEPLLFNRQSEKVKRELLMPTGRKTMAERAANLKHDPLAEYRASAYVLPNDDAPTFLAALAAWFKKAMMNAALDLPGAKKSQVGRLLWVNGERLPLYGVPELHMSVTRSADINRTPDVRTRCCVPRWATELTISFVTPLLNQRSVLNLLAAAGLIAGVGDDRPEKGHGTFGQFAMVNHDNPVYQDIVATGGRAAQVAAMGNPAFYDDEAESLYRWFEAEVGRRGKSSQVALPAAD